MRWGARMGETSASDMMVGALTDPFDGGSRSDVELRLPADSAYVSVLRTTSAWLAAPMLIDADHMIIPMISRTMSISISVNPKQYTSLAGVAGSPAACSGDR